MSYLIVYRLYEKIVCLKFVSPLKITIMAKNIDLNSRRWLDLVFEGRNKKFGAYELRESSSQRHILAIGVVIIAILALVFLPRLMKRPTVPPVVPVIQQGVVEFIENPIVPEKMPARAVEVQAPAAPTPTQRTIGFTETIIVTEGDVRPEDVMLRQDELTNSEAAIGTATREGEAVGRHPDDPVIAEPAAEEVSTPRFTAEVWPKPDRDLLKWLGNNIRYPVDALELGIEGRVVLRFVVQVDGSITNVEVLQKLFPSCDREAVRVVNKMPKWIPGSEGGRVVAVFYTLPIQFRIQK